jgi:hypothetical protein
MQKVVPAPEPNAADKAFFPQLRLDLDHQLSGYAYERPLEAIGSPLSPEIIRGSGRWRDHLLRSRRRSLGAHLAILWQQHRP